MSLSEDELKSLMLLALDGDQTAYKSLLTALKTRLDTYFGRRLRSNPSEAEDLVQETLLAIHDKRATFDREQKLTVWVYAIASYKLADHFRRNGRVDLVPLLDDDASVSDDSAAADARRDLAWGLEALPTQTRDMLVSVKIEGETIADVAERTGLSQSAVKVAVHRGFKKLADRLRGKGERP